MHKNIVSNNLKEFVLSLEAAVKEGYSVVEESVAFESGFWKVLTKQDRLAAQVEMPAVLGAEVAVALLDNPTEPNEKLKGILEFSPVVEVAEGTKMETSEGTVVTQPVVAQKPKRNRK